MADHALDVFLALGHSLLTHDMSCTPHQDSVYFSLKSVSLRLGIFLHSCSDNTLEDLDFSLHIVLSASICSFVLLRSVGQTDFAIVSHGTLFDLANCTVAAFLVLETLARLRVALVSFDLSNTFDHDSLRSEYFTSHSRG